MATILEDFSVRVPAVVGSLTFGNNLFAGIMPTSPDAVTAMYEYPGDATEYVMGPVANKGGLAHQRVQIVTRIAEGSYLAGRNLIESVTAALEVANTTINGTFYERIERMQQPFFLHRDAARRIYFAVNLTCIRNE